MRGGIQYIALKSTVCQSHEPLGRRGVAYIPQCKTFTLRLHFTVSQINLLVHRLYSLAVCWKWTTHVSVCSFQNFLTYTISSAGVTRSVRTVPGELRLILLSEIYAPTLRVEAKI